MRAAANPNASPGNAAWVSQIWLVRFRSLLVAGGAVLVVAARYLGGWGGGWELSTVLPVWLLLAAMLLSNLALSRRLRSGRSIAVGALALVLTFDIAVLTWVLALTGGATNPFSSAFLIPIAVGALLLPPGHAFVVVIAAIGGYSGLYWFRDPHAGHDPDSMNLHLLGMWVAFVLVGPMMAYAVTRLRQAIADSEARLAVSLERQTRAEKLAALATLSAGAAHELATPLATIAVVARELERREGDADLRADACLIREEIDRCSEILSQLAVDVGAGMGEAVESTRIGDLVHDLDLGSGNVQLDASPELLARCIVLPRRLCVRALSGLLKNARQASSEEQPVEVRIDGSTERLRIEIGDRGRGMDEEVQRRAGEPFFTTKPAGQGMGLGLFFARSVFEQLGGELWIESQPGRGTRVSVELPWVVEA
jgi:two-component system sensor histidine kinase RegB